MKDNITKIRAVSLPGAGAAGGGMVGALAALSHRKYKDGQPMLDAIENVAGVSAGFLIGLMLALGASPSFIKRKMDEFDFGKVDDECVIEQAYNMVTEHGLFDGDYIIKFLKKCIRELGFNENITPRQHFEIMSKRAKPESGQGHMRYLMTVLTDRDRTPHAQIVTHDTPGFCDEPWWSIGRATMAIPFYFTEHEIFDRCFIDGGITSNNAIVEGIQTFGILREQWICLNMSSRAEIEWYVHGRESVDPDHSILADAKDMITDVGRNQLYQLHQEGYSKYIVYIDRLGVSSTSFKEAARLKAELYKSGYDCTMVYLDGRPELAVSQGNYRPSQGGQHASQYPDPSNSSPHSAQKASRSKSCTIL